jgi:hypothetical protein
VVNILVGKFEEKREIGINYKILEWFLWEKDGDDGLEAFGAGQDQWRAFLEALMNIRFPKDRGTF